MDNMLSKSDGFNVWSVTLAVASEGYLLRGRGDRGWDRCQDDNAAINDVEDGDLRREFGSPERDEADRPGETPPTRVNGYSTILAEPILSPALPSFVS